MKNLAFALSLLAALPAVAQKITKIDPPSWWVGMEHDTVEFMVYGEDISGLNAESSTLQVLRSEGLTSANYLFVTAVVPENTTIGSHAFTFRNSKGKRVAKASIDILERRPESAARKGFSSADFIYLIMPDRFRNGNPNNDAVKGMLESPNRSFQGGRHGGDIEGIRQSLGYFKDLGVSALWLNPVVENDMPAYSYHGYAMTDLYQVDKRYGTNEEYKQLSKEAKEAGIGLIMDQVANHIGSYHEWMEDLPSEDWINQWDEFTETSHMKVTRFDPHAAEVDKKRFTDGWFVKTMPDLNQRNEKLAKYLIQNSIWWVEYLDLYGIRMDTWPYPDADFLTDWTKAILDEYPNFNIVGEEWISDPALISYWQDGVKRHDDYASYLPSVMDFPLQTAIVEGLMDDGGWRPAMSKVYESLANDYKYANTNNVMIFPDNHDMSRIFTRLEEDFDKWKMAMSMYFTMRGTLQFFYGTEILMSNPGTEDHGIIRSDFPGGWPEDTVNAFTGEGLSSQALEAQNWIKTLAKLRRESCALNMGTTLHYTPNDEIYVYFRSFEQEHLMVVVNKNTEAKEIELDRFEQGLNGATTAHHLITGEDFELHQNLQVGPMETLILELK